ncbi:MAG: four helix bundle protein, partial [Ilyomonas sp.]
CLKMKNFKELKIWQKGFEIAVDSYTIINSLPSSDRSSLAQQFTHAAVSIPSIIAEGGSRSSEKDFCRFLEMSLGSSFELETQLLIAKAGHSNAGQITVNNTLTKLDEEQKMIISFMKKINLTHNS